VSERWIWVVRLVGIVVFLVLMYLLMSLHAQLVKMNDEHGAGDKPVGALTLDCEMRIAKFEASDVWTDA
jgi:hypothetical protein